jgi:uncharacterized protein (TIGR02996 family)
VRGEDLLAAVLARPDDETPRLVYADWLTERGDPRGFLIQLQCALARGTGPREELEKRARKLLDKHEARWVAPFQHLVEKWEWRRGFVEAAVAPGARIAPALEEIVRHTPLRRLTVVRIAAPDLARLLGSRALLRLRELDLSINRLGAGGAAAIAACATVARLEELVLAEDDLGDEGATALAGAGHLGALRTLGLERNGIGDRGALALAEAAPAHLPALRRLHLRGNEIGPAGRQALERWRASGRRRELDL